jgi:hypothetical protein
MEATGGTFPVGFPPGIQFAGVSDQRINFGDLSDIVLFSGSTVLQIES